MRKSGSRSKLIRGTEMCNTKYLWVEAKRSLIAIEKVIDLEKAFFPSKCHFGCLGLSERQTFQWIDIFFETKTQSNLHKNEKMIDSRIIWIYIVILIRLWNAQAARAGLWNVKKGEVEIKRNLFTWRRAATLFSFLIQTHDTYSTNDRFE